jgi:hypothetical protein
MTTRRRRSFNRLVTTAFAALLVTSACASTDNDLATDTGAKDASSPALSAELTGKQFDVYRDPG